MQYVPFWVSVAKAAVYQLVFSHASLQKNLPEILSAAEKSIGIENDTLRPNGILGGGTYDETAAAIDNVLKQFNVESNITRAKTVAAFENNLSAGKIVPVCRDLREKLERTKLSGKLLFLVTTDNPKMTDRCLRALKIRDLFDSVFCNDGIHPAKPSAYAAGGILQLCKLKKYRCLYGGRYRDGYEICEKRCDYVRLSGKQRECAKHGGLYVSERGGVFGFYFAGRIVC